MRNPFTFLEASIVQNVFHWHLIYKNIFLFAHSFSDFYKIKYNLVNFYSAN